MDSSRLPGKALMDIGGRPLLGHVIDRVRRVRDRASRGFPVVVATSDHRKDDPVADFARAEGVAVFRGAAEDVAKRCVDCAEAFGFDDLARISGDSPFIDAHLMALMIAERQRRGVDIATNVLPRSCPAGNAMEIVTTEAMRRVLSRTQDPEDREHVTRYIYGHPEEFTIWSHHEPPEAFAGVRVVVDAPEDLERARWIVSRLDGPVATAPFASIAELSRQWKESA